MDVSFGNVLFNNRHREYIHSSLFQYCSGFILHHSTIETHTSIRSVCFGQMKTVIHCTFAQASLMRFNFAFVTVWEISCLKLLYSCVLLRFASQLWSYHSQHSCKETYSYWVSSSNYNCLKVRFYLAISVAKTKSFRFGTFMARLNRSWMIFDCWFQPDLFLTVMAVRQVTTILLRHREYIYRSVKHKLWLTKPIYRLYRCWVLL